MSGQKQQQSQPIEQVPLLDKHQIIAVGGTLLTTGIAELATHNPAVIAAGVLATIAAGKLTPAFREIITRAFVPADPDETANTTEKVLNALPVKDNSDLPQDAISKMKRLFNIESPESPAQPKDGNEDATPSRRTQRNARPPVNNDDEQRQSWIPPKFPLEDVLSILDPLNKQGQVYFGDSADGAIALDLAKMYHVLDLSPSGSGKSNRFRLGMMQMVRYCETYYINPLAAEVKVTKDKRKVEVWKPIYDLLANEKPMQEADEINQIMTALVAEIMDRNERERRRDFAWQEQPVFVFIDELPEVYARCPHAVKMLDKIGRLGRQFYVFCWIACQTARVDDIGLSPAAQAQFKTRLYGGGDKTSTDRVMKGLITKETERTLHGEEGLIVMLAEDLDGLAFTRSPLITNEGLFDYLGLPPFKLSDWLPAEPAPVIRGSKKRALDLSLTLSPDLSQSLSRSLSQDEDTPIHAQDTQITPVKGQTRESVKGPNEEAILEAIDELEADGKPLTLNAIAKKAGLSWRAYDEIEAVAIRCGHDLAQGKGRPAEK